MGLNVGANLVSTVRLGLSQVAAIYKGIDLIWQDKVPAGQIVVTTSQAITIPKGVKKIDIFLVGGGGGGQKGGGGAGYTKTYKDVTVIPLLQATIVIGAGGNGGKPQFYDGSNGGETSVVVNGSAYTASGGSKDILSAETSWKPKGGAGGSGGGAFGYRTEEGYYPAGGSNGGNGANGVDSSGYVNYGGAGQGRTTKAFEEVSGTLYAGGGGGGRYTQNYSTGYAGGAGGGGNGAGGSSISNLYNATSGTPSTGGGGGGGHDFNGTNESYNTVGGKGGSGLVIIRWAEQ